MITSGNPRTKSDTASSKFQKGGANVSELKTTQPDYGNWISLRMPYAFGALAILLFALSFVFPLVVIGAIAFLATFGYVAYVRYRLSPRGGDLQAQIRELVLRHIDWDGKGCALDIGCGNAPLTIGVAKRFAIARVTGVDYWGGKWEYSRAVCERNAKIEGVADRVNFQKASASALPFEAESFDAAVSNFVFHEVSDTTDKRDVVKEALRVVKKGGAFAFQDLFSERVYGDLEDLLEVISGWGIESVELLDTSHSDVIPKALRLPFVFGPMRLLYGKK